MKGRIRGGEEGEGKEKRRTRTESSFRDLSIAQLAHSGTGTGACGKRGTPSKNQPQTGAKLQKRQPRGSDRASHAFAEISSHKPSKYRGQGKR